MLTPEQSRAARALLDWSQSMLAGHAGIAESTIRNFEKRRHTLTRNNLAAIHRAFEAAGVEFTNADEPGVKLRRKP